MTTQVYLWQDEADERTPAATHERVKGRRKKTEKGERRRRRRTKNKRQPKESAEREREKRREFSIVGSIGDPDGTALTSLLHR